MISTGITKLAIGMNQPPIDHPGPRRGFDRPSASLFLAARHIQMMKTTAVASVKKPKRSDGGAGQVVGVLSALYQVETEPAVLEVVDDLQPVRDRTDREQRQHGVEQNSTVSAVGEPAKGTPRAVPAAMGHRKGRPTGGPEVRTGGAGGPTRGGAAVPSGGGGREAVARRRGE